MIRDIFHRNHVPMRVGNGSPLALFESGLLEKFCDSIHLDQMLDILLLVQALLRYLQFLVALEVAPTPAPPTTKALLKATAQFFEAAN